MILTQFVELLRGPALRQRVLGPVSFDATILVTNLVTGIIIARSLGPAGRGELAAILIVLQVGSWIFSLGAAESVAYHQTRHPDHGPRLLSSWLLMALPLWLLATLTGELMLPILFSAQTEHAIELGRIFMPIVLLPLLTIIFNAVLLGDHRFNEYNSVRLLLPAGVALGYVILLPLGALTVESALVVNGSSMVISTSLSAFLCLRRHGLRSPLRWLTRDSVVYGAKAHGGSLAGFVNARLDLLIIPAFLTATEVGLYSVATNVASVVSTLTATVAMIALPLATRESERSARLVIRTLHAVLLLGGCLCVILIAVAPIGIRIVYGGNFVAAATALRILLPGQVLSAGAAVLWSGMLAANRPLLATAAAIPGAIFTITGLLLFLQEGGIETAATITTIAYSLVFALSVIGFRHISKVRWRDFLKAPPALTDP